jgi:hypothetical protein
VEERWKSSTCSEFPGMNGPSIPLIAHGPLPDKHTFSVALSSHPHLRPSFRAQLFYRHPLQDLRILFVSCLLRTTNGAIAMRYQLYAQAAWRVSGGVQLSNLFSLCAHSSATRSPIPPREYMPTVYFGNQDASCVARQRRHGR